MIRRMLTLLPEALIVVAVAVDTVSRLGLRAWRWLSRDHEPFPMRPKPKRWPGDEIIPPRPEGG